MKKEPLILVVDDEPDVVEILSYNLQKGKYRVIKAYNGKEAIRLAIEFEPDLIIMDIRMPELSGLDACRQIRKTENIRDTPVLFLTADSDEYTTLNAFDAGASHFITKPIVPGLLMKMIVELLKS